jgi:hypothetical protein
LIESATSIINTDTYLMYIEPCLATGTLILDTRQRTKQRLYPRTSKEMRTASRNLIGATRKLLRDIQQIYGEAEGSSKQAKWLVVGGPIGSWWFRTEGPGREARRPLGFSFLDSFLLRRQSMNSTAWPSSLFTSGPPRTAVWGGRRGERRWWGSRTRERWIPFAPIRGC